ncbi:MAG: peptide deformylase [Eubacteriales bacterium]|nr:peptide deformylase [Eubacteriales bacterium]
MALRKVFQEGEDILRKKARPVERFDDRLAELAQDMLETMKEENGVGLAATQVGILKQMFVMNLGDEVPEELQGDFVIVNPKISNTAGEQELIEGCLSLPGLYAHVKRPEKLTLHYQDLEGKEHEMDLSGFPAVCVCHETDHLHGILFRDKASEPLFRLDAEGRPQTAKVAQVQDDGSEI